MDLRHELKRLFPATALIGWTPFGPEPAGDADLTVLFTDIEDYTGLTERLGDRASRELVRVHDRIVRDAVAACGGREIKHTGDGIMACFASASRALEAAVSIQKNAEASNLERSEPGWPLRIAIGMNTGAPILDDGDLFGTAVIVASRLTDCASGGQVLATEVVRLLAAGKGFEFRSAGSRCLEGMSEEVPLFEVVWQESRKGNIAA
jgi:adenylate cyclase